VDDRNEQRSLADTLVLVLVLAGDCKLAELTRTTRDTF
jgi:hypothetical protein